MAVPTAVDGVWRVCSVVTAASGEFDPEAAGRCGMALERLDQLAPERLLGAGRRRSARGPRL